MSERVARLSRLVEVLGQIQRLAEAQLAERRRAVHDLEQTERDLVAALGSDSALHGLFLDTHAAHLKRLAIELVGARQATDRTARRAVRAAVRLKAAERALARERIEAERLAERRRLEELAAAPRR